LSRIYANALKGVPVCEVQNVLPEVVKRIKLREEAPEVIQWFKDNGFILVLMSASPIEVVRVMASKLHFDEAYGLKLETKDGIYTGKFFTVTSKYKRNIIKKKLKKYWFSVGVGDNWCDMEAYQNLDIRFLMDDEYKGNERFVEGKTLVIKNLKEMPKFLMPILYCKCGLLNIFCTIEIDFVTKR
jgi:phosphoserine phosphatase